MSRSLDDLKPPFRGKVGFWQADMATAGIDHIITCTLRTRADQQSAWDKGRTTMGPDPDADHPLGHIVTHALPGQSAHQYGYALNFVVLEHGKPDWSGKGALWDKAIALAEARGLQSLRPMESAHLQDPDWKQLAGVTLHGQS